MKRLASPVEFRRAYREGRRASNDWVIVHARPNGLGLLRVGVSVPSRIGTAVMRNRIKRRLRAVLRALRGVPAGLDLVVVPRDAATNASFVDLAGAVQDAAARAAGERDER